MDYHVSIIVSIIYLDPEFELEELGFEIERPFIGREYCSYRRSL